MVALDIFEILFVITGLLFQVILIIHFAVRKWRFELAIRYGWMVYALSIPAAVVSVFILVGGQSWFFWVSGFLYLTWSIFGFIVEYVRRIEWRNPIRWPVFGPYIFLYLSTVMFYWWPLARIYKPLWCISAVLFIFSSILNLSSHQKKSELV